MSTTTLNSSTLSTTTFDRSGPLLVSELPPVPALGMSRPALLRARVMIRLAERRFERALRQAGPGEYGDLIAASRRSS